MKNVVILILAVSLLFSSAFSQQRKSNIYPFALEFDPNRNLMLTFKEPKGFSRFPMSRMTRYMAWLTNLPLKPKDHPLIQYNKQIVVRADSIGGVIDIGIASNNQQDADFPLQLALEYLKSVKLLDDFPVILNETDTVTFGNWLNGRYRFDARSNMFFEKGEKREYSESEFYRFLEFCIRKNTNKTLINNLDPVSEDDLIPGDIYVQFLVKDPDSTGHVAVIYDVCSNEDGLKLYLTGWGGDPAQSYIVACPQPKGNRIWFTLDELKEQLSDYGKGSFYRYSNLINR